MKTFPKTYNGQGRCVFMIAADEDRHLAIFGRNLLVLMFPVLTLIPEIYSGTPVLNPGVLMGVLVWAGVFNENA